MAPVYFTRINKSFRWIYAWSSLFTFIKENWSRMGNFNPSCHKTLLNLTFSGISLLKKILYWRFWRLCWSIITAIGLGSKIYISLKAYFIQQKRFSGSGAGLICNVIARNRPKKLAAIAISGHKNHSKTFTLTILSLFKFWIYEACGCRAL